ncbi:hypothetical protein COOONC_22617 [Cooperia oncophora]
MSLLVGQNAKIMCTATGIPAPVIKWSKDGGATFPAALQHRLFVRPNDDHLYVVNVTVEDQAKNSFNVTLKDTEWTFNGEPLFVDGERVSLKAHGQILAVKKVCFLAYMAKPIQIIFKSSDAGQYACELWAANDQLARQVATVVVVGREEIKKDPNSQQNF